MAAGYGLKTLILAEKQELLSHLVCQSISIKNKYDLN
jgi:hypothetical protein